MGTPDVCVHVQVVYATPECQRLYEVRIPRGATVSMAIVESGIAEDFPEVQFGDYALGIFGERVTDSTVVNDGDRIEIYRPLIADAKESRRRRAAKRAGR
jgi:uncharacterized protein